MSEFEGKFSDCVNPGVLERANALAEEFRDAQPFKFIVIDDFFKPDYCQSLRDDFPAFDEQLAVNEDGVVGSKAVREQIRDISPSYQLLDELTSSEEFRELVGRITGIEGLNHDPYYFGGGTHENLHGQGLDAHVDFNYHPITREHRRLNLIVYLNEEWQDEWGGSLQLHRDPYLPPSQDDITLLTPLMNRCVIFETNEYSWHGFKRIVLPEDKQHLSRKSFALYYYTRERPPKETAAEHSTIYVEEHLPEWYYPDMTLDAGELQNIRNKVASRDQHLKRLYGHIKQQNTRIRDLNYQLSLTEAESIPVEIDTEDTDQVEKEIARLNAELARAKQRVGQLESSTSWKLTAPIRALKRLFTVK